MPVIYVICKFFEQFFFYKYFTSILRQLFRSFNPMPSDNMFTTMSIIIDCNKNPVNTIVR